MRSCLRRCFVLMDGIHQSETSHETAGAESWRMDAYHCLLAVAVAYLTSQKWAWRRNTSHSARVLRLHGSHCGQEVVMGGRVMVMSSDWAFDGCCLVSGPRAGRTTVSLESETV